MLVNGARHAFCIHVDAKVDPIIRDSVHRMANCYKQRYPGITIIVPNDTIPVYWGHFSLLERSVHLHATLDQWTINCSMDHHWLGKASIENLNFQSLILVIYYVDEGSTIRIMIGNT